jgi:DNA-directed RNA polymerase specialized sigma54-like protein
VSSDSSSSSSPPPPQVAESDDELMELLQNQPSLARQVYVSPVLWNSNEEWKSFMFSSRQRKSDDDSSSISTTPTTRYINKDHLWEQIKLEAIESLKTQPEAGPQLYQGILSQGYLLESIVTIIARTFKI